MKRISLILAVIAMLPILISQSPTPRADGNYVPGELIIQLRDNASLSRESLVDKFKTEFSHFRIQEIKALSPRMNIFLMSFDGGRTADQEILRSVRSSDNVLNAQFNHYTEMREQIPVDDSFDLQWALHNTGQSGGTPDADIDGPEAWDYATGGVAASGDTLIICIVDDGFDLEHLDIDYWKNWHEIPDNDIDDDGNGYVDDYDGWNASSGNPIIIERDHGTHVTGIAAATGNNDRGVAGVNWNTKVFPVVGSSTVESIVVAAYSYVYEMRKLYNETNGEKGAFIVCTNSSFGVNNGQPEDYPIWGAMYDSMGYVGILSAAATANATINVDEDGDIPTAFPNEHLITVTNTTRFDEKQQYAAYGLTTIDMGAPGTEIYSTRYENGYGYKTGCSMSSPHVAGAAALMFAAADAEFMTDYKSDPATFALVIKNLLLQGTDPLESLQNITVTGGRLNIYNSIKMFSDPELQVTPWAIGVELEPEMSALRDMTLTNNTTVAFNYSITKPASATWITLQSSSGNLQPAEFDVIQLTISSYGLPIGVYTEWLNIAYGNGLNYSMPVRLEVNNNGTQMYLYYTDQEFEITSTATSVTTTINSNTNWLIEETAPWVTPSIINGNGNASVTFEIAENTWLIPRQCLVYLTNPGLSDTLTITQEAAFEPSLDSDQDTIYLASNAGSYTTVGIISNTDWEATANQSWLVATPPSGSGNQSLTIRTLTSNNGTEVRNGSVTLKYSANGQEAKFIICKQLPPAGIEDNSLSDLIKISPNPANDKLFIDLSDLNLDVLEIRLINASTGILSKNILPDNSNLITLNVDDLASGLYFILFRTNEGSGLKKVMIVK